MGNRANRKRWTIDGRSKGDNPFSDGCLIAMDYGREKITPYPLQASVLLLDSAPGLPSWLASSRDEASQLLRERAGLSWR